MNKREQIDKALGEIADKVVQGWTLTGKSCPVCLTTLVRSPRGQLYCCLCQAFAISEQEAAAKNLKSKPPASASSTQLDSGPNTRAAAQMSEALEEQPRLSQQIPSLDTLKKQLREHMRAEAQAHDAVAQSAAASSSSSSPQPLAPASSPSLSPQRGPMVAATPPPTAVKLPAPMPSEFDEDQFVEHLLSKHSDPYHYEPDPLSTQIGEKLLQRWVMLAPSCPNSNCTVRCVSPHKPLFAFILLRFNVFRFH